MGKRIQETQMSMADVSGRYPQTTVSLTLRDLLSSKSERMQSSTSFSSLLLGSSGKSASGTLPKSSRGSGEGDRWQSRGLRTTCRPRTPSSSRGK